MRLNAIQFGTSILAAQLLLSQAAAISKVEEEQKLRGSHGLKSQISKRALSETSNIESAQSSEAKVSDDAESQAYAFADDLFGLTWGDRDMSYVGGDEFIQMYDDGVETRIIIRGYMDINVQDGPSNGETLLFNNNPLYDIYLKERGQAQGTCAQVVDDHFTCALTLEIEDDDEPRHIVASFNTNGDIYTGQRSSKLTIKDGYGELESVTGSHKVAPVNLNTDTDPATPVSDTSTDQFEYFFFETVLYVSSGYLHDIMEESDDEAEEEER